MLGGVDGAPVLRHQVLAARQTTDVLVLDFGALLPASSPRIAKTVAEALRLAGARCLQLNPRELGARFHPSGEKGFCVVIFDIHPGGAGHALELFTRADQWIGSHLQKVLFVSDEHNHRCRTACLDCLRTFGEPSEEDGIEFDRVATVEWLRELTTS